VSGFSGGIFLSYRREDAGPYARLLQRDLSERFPDSRVFIDLDSIAAGRDFAEVISEAVNSCAVLVALIGRQWATLTDKRGQRRIDDPDDLVRFEVQVALERGVLVVPVLVDDAEPLRRQQLPAELQKLARLNALELSYGRYDYDAGRLFDLIQQRLAAATQPGAQTSVHPPDSRTQGQAAQPALEPQDARENHGKDLDEIRFVLQAMVTAQELSHLKNLARGSTANYTRNESLQGELRRLRSIGLINSKRLIAEMPDKFDLAEWVELTDRGVDYLRWLEKG
jgi:hypothetical protein